MMLHKLNMNEGGLFIQGSILPFLTMVILKFGKSANFTK